VTASWARDGRRKRFEQIFDDHFRAVQAYAIRRASREDVDDAVAETFLIAWRRLDDVPPRARPWLFGVARRVLANQRRAAGRRVALAARVAGERASEPHRSEAESAVAAALHRLGERDREVLMLVAWEGLAPDELASALGCSRAAAKVRLHRAKRRLRSSLEAGTARPTTKLMLEECHDE
jgi:RNA polymerase sigma-70 factor (ECF subfamily)